ncbi:hypothetical protein GIB67_016172 [Kingdonia uniflora]|uniref:Uncharacterized protein n=1 Tax=Kingdonia uniflora TaxID=39325 RepID=A0A7J7NA06_9MAGN|nr:hypothetical protein GIB67_016172 [Kingdonia uniflora]
MWLLFYFTRDEQKTIFGVFDECLLEMDIRKQAFKVKDIIYLVSRLKKYIHKYSWIIRSKNILHPRSLKIFYIEDICKSFHEEIYLHHLKKLYA